VTKVYDARLATRSTTSVDTRLRQLALMSRPPTSHALDNVLDAALPTAEDLTARFTRLARGCQEPPPQPPPGRAGQAAAGPRPPAATAPEDGTRAGRRCRP